MSIFFLLYSTYLLFHINIYEEYETEYLRKLVKMQKAELLYF